MKCAIALLVLLSLYVPIPAVSSLDDYPTKESFREKWGSIQLYYNYCMESLDTEDIEYLVSTADENGLLFFTVIIEGEIIILPIFADDLVAGRSPFDAFKDKNK